MVWLYETKIWKKKVKLCYMDTDSFIAYIKMKGIYVDIATDSTWNYELERSWLKGKIRKQLD